MDSPTEPAGSAASVGTSHRPDCTASAIVARIRSRAVVRRAASSTARAGAARGHRPGPAIASRSVRSSSAGPWPERRRPDGTSRWTAPEGLGMRVIPCSSSASSPVSTAPGPACRPGAGPNASAERCPASPPRAAGASTARPHGSGGRWCCGGRPARSACRRGRPGLRTARRTRRQEGIGARHHGARPGTARNRGPRTCGRAPHVVDNLPPAAHHCGRADRSRHGCGPVDRSHERGSVRGTGVGRRVLSGCSRRAGPRRARRGPRRPRAGSRPGPGRRATCPRPAGR